MYIVNFVMTVRRTQLASDDLFKSACTQVKNVRGVKKVKNISEDAFGTKLGRIHVPSQEISKIQVTVSKSKMFLQKIF
jgi:ribosome production factor 2